MSWLRDQLGWEGKVRYAIWRLAGRRPLTVRLTTGDWLILRPPPCTDLATANEIFVQDCYRSPRPVDPQAIRIVADLGANVGYSILHWLRFYPQARVVAFEPHPTHCGQIRQHLALNPGRDRVELVEAAAGVADGTAVLSDNENCSTVVGTQTGITIPVVDVFARLAGRPVDLLKVDIEGGEYSILADPRMRDLRAGQIALEWHAVDGSASGPDWCERRLAELGYETVHLAQAGSHGTLWAFTRS